MEIECSNCKTKLLVTEIGAVGMAGCYEYEQAICPICGSIVYKKRTDGTLQVSIIK